MDLIITLSSPLRPREIRGRHDGSRAGFSTDPKRAKPCPTRREARQALDELRRRFPQQAQVIGVNGQHSRLSVNGQHSRPRWQRMVGFAAGLALAGWLAGCSHAPVSAEDCGRHYVGGSGLLGLAGSIGAFDREAGPNCRLRGSVANFGSYIPPNAVTVPADPPPLPDNRPRFLVRRGLRDPHGYRRGLTAAPRARWRWIVPGDALARLRGKRPQVAGAGPP
jgi:hypothetical protein